MKSERLAAHTKRSALQQKQSLSGGLHVDLSSDLIQCATANANNAAVANAANTNNAVAIANVANATGSNCKAPPPPPPLLRNLRRRLKDGVRRCFGRRKRDGQKRNNWFRQYQSIDGCDGQRDLSYREAFFQRRDFAGKTVLDLGCNVGQMCRFAHQLGARAVIGVDYDQNAINYAQRNNAHDNVFYLCDDADNYFCLANLPRVDTTLFLSVIETVEIENKMGILSKVAHNTDVLYLEGHNSSTYRDLIAYLLQYTSFAQIEFVGRTFDNADYHRRNIARHLFRCSNERLRRDEAMEKIRVALQTDRPERIAVVGNAGVGKTTFRNQLLAHLRGHGFDFSGDSSVQNKIKFIDVKKGVIIIDDIARFDYSNYKKVVYIDYRALDYMHDASTVFYFRYDIPTRLESTCRNEIRKLDRSPQGLMRHVDTIARIYSVIDFGSDGARLSHTPRATRFPASAGIPENDGEA